MPLEYFKTCLNALTTTGKLTPQPPAKAKRWTLAGTAGAERAAIAKNLKVLSGKNPPRTGSMKRAEFHLSGAFGKEKSILAVLGYNTEGQKDRWLTTERASASVHYDGNGNYRITLHREEGPLESDVEALTRWWLKEHVRQ